MAVLALLAAAPLRAESPPPLPSAGPDPFAALAAIKTRDDIWERSFDSLYEQMRAAFRTDPAIDRNLNPQAERRTEAALRGSRWYAPYLKLHPRIQQLRFEISRDTRTSSSDRGTMNDAIRLRSISTTVQPSLAP